MKFFLSVLSVNLMGLSVFAAPSDVIVDNGGVEKWIQDLSSDTFQVREKASIELWKLGAAGMPALREAVLSKDPEVSMRAKEAIDKVELKITKDTPVAILDLINAYRKAPLKDKLNLLNELKEAKANYQLLKLYSMENAESQRELTSVVQDVAILAARESIMANDVNLAIELLRMAPSNHSELMALACLYRSMGQLDQQLTNLNPPQKLNPELWKGYLLRAKGDLDGAIKNAEETNQLQLLAGLRALNGDPVLWLEQNNAPGHRPETPQRAQKTYIDIALKRWRGEVVNKKDFEPFTKALAANNRTQRSQVMSSLVLLGEIEMIEKIQSKDNPSNAFQYYISREEIDKALEVFGLDPNKPDYAKWAKKEFDNIKEGEGSQNFMVDIMMMASFLGTRGLEKELDEAFSQPLADLLQDEPDLYWKTIRIFFNDKIASHFALKHLSKWAGEDKERWRDVFSSVLGEEEFVVTWLDWIREIDPKLKDEEALEVMLAIFKMSGSPGKLRETWMNRIWKVVQDEKDKVKKEELITLVMSLCVQQQDAQNTLKAWDMLNEEQRAKANWGFVDRYLSAAGRWEDAAKTLVSFAEDLTLLKTPEVHAHLAATFRRVGMVDKAKYHDEMADKLALGSTESSMDIANCYVYGGDYERANMWFERAAFEVDPRESEFKEVLEKYAQQCVQRRNWKLAASCHEVIVHIYASQQYFERSFSEYSKDRMSADFSKAMCILPDDRESALKTLKDIHQDFISDGVLADDFFPVLREVGLDKELNEWFLQSWKLMAGVIEKYPKSHNSRNTVVWFASRAGLKLAEAEKYQREALSMSPEQAAYLDTMAELKFAQGDRKAALEWSQRSVSFAPFDDMIRAQHERFRSAPLPKN